MIHLPRFIKAGDTSVAFLNALAAISKLAPKAMRKESQTHLHSTNPTIFQHEKSQEWTKSLHDEGWHSIHPCPYRRSPFHCTRENCQWIVHNNTKSPWAGTNNLSTRKRYHQQRWPLRDQPQQRLHPKHAGGSRPDNIPDRNNSRDSGKQGKQRRQWEHTSQQRRTCTLQNCWKTLTDDIHKTRPELCNTRASRFSTTANIPWHEKSAAYTEVPTRYARVQVHPTSGDNTRKQQGSQQRCQEEQQFTSDRKRIRTVLL